MEIYLVKVHIYVPCKDHFEASVWIVLLLSLNKNKMSLRAFSCSALKGKLNMSNNKRVGTKLYLYGCKSGSVAAYVCMYDNV